MSHIKLVVIGLITGSINGLLGVGGGTFLIPALTHVKKLKQHIAHGTTISVILPTALASAAIYGFHDRVDYLLALKVIASGALGSFLGAKLMNFLNPDFLKRIFATFIIITGIWLIMS
ncbi:sulfite exporter TauE/SafE family protein [Natranaerobius thermophilus]|uniref:Probable membrane transporter protein n=1 Tax=Natranaerobius thermophilus (strain ATCC BAA-1301 / DSM 18059 / JW/NM-WN-LF) TaxID=457570 RepID=B2A3K1_NATTJ|nr:sulfite exporter TauE/SafE family protein [Natranaerobius thermophilus]ACB86430.1 permease [Natranaerobius thermophilus JW/NM-WN-LF]